MAGQVLSLFARPKNRDWSQQELAEFYRVESALSQSGLSVETDRGLSDEGEPWFVFCRMSDGEVVIHFARCDGQFIVAGPGYERVARGFDFTALVRDLVSRHPLVNTKARTGSNVILHPTALLIAVVAAALLKNGEAQAKDNELESSSPRNRDVIGEAGGGWLPSINFSSSITVDVRHLALVMAAVAVALPTSESEFSSPSNDRLPLLRDTLGEANGVGKENQYSQARHALGSESGSFGDEANSNSQDTNHAVISSEQKLEIVSLTSILLELSTEVPSLPDVAARDFQPPNLAQEFTLQPTADAEHFLKIDLVKGSSEFPLIKAVASSVGEGAILPVTLSVLQPFLDHATHLQGAAQSALDVLKPMAQNGTIDAALIALLENEQSSGEVDTNETTDHLSSGQMSGEINLDSLPAGGRVNAFEADVIFHAVEVFVREQNYAISLHENDVIFYDREALSSSSPDLSIRSVTWDFWDGSSITLIGHLSHLPIESLA